MAQCWKCGGQMPAYAARCSWCGRSTSLSALLQVVSVTVVVVGALVVGGVVPMGAISRFLPGLHSDGGPVAVEASATPEPDQPAAAPGSPAAPRTTGPATAGAGRGGLRPPTRAAEPPTQALTSGRNSCESSDRVNALAVLHRDWSRADLLLIACRKVAVGFSAAKVTASIGRPRLVNRQEGTLVEEWVYPDRVVVLDRGVVVSVRK